MHKVLSAYCVFIYFVVDNSQGSVLCAKFCPDSPYSLVVGGEKNGFHIINVSSLPQGIINFHEQFVCNNYFMIIIVIVVQRFKDRQLMAPVTPPSQVFTSLSSKPPLRDVSVWECVWLC